MSALAYSTRTFSFSAAHRYWVDAWSAAENQRAFGRLTTPHGHHYRLEVTARGAIDERTGMVVDLADMKRIVNEAVVARFDHSDLNGDELFKDRVPTTENIALAVWDLLVPKVGRERLWQVRVWEDDALYVDYRGE